MKNFITILLAIFGTFSVQAQCDLVINGDFEQGSTGFTSDYISANSGSDFHEGDYWIYTDDTNSCIDILDHTNCEENISFYEHVMLINGKYGQAANTTNRVWETAQSMTVTTGVEYEFQFFVQKFRNLFESCNTGWLELSVELSYDQRATWSPIPGTFLVVNSQGACDWRRLTKNFAAQGPSLDIRIMLNEVGGTGNAFALDDITLLEQQYPLTMTGQASLSNNTPSNDDPLSVTASIGGSITALDDNYYLPSACNNYAWAILENGGLLATGGAAQGWGTTTSFPGVTFTEGNAYVINLTTSCPGCYGGTTTVTYSFQINGSNFARQSKESNKVEFKSTKILEGRELEEFNKLLINQNTTQKDSDDDITIWPNPSKNNVSIKFDKKPLAVSIMDMKGAAIYDNRNVNNLQLENIDISKVPTGIYLVTVEFEDGVVTKKIVKDGNSQEIRK